MNYQIEPLLNKDWLQVRSIYAESISTGVASFDTKPPNSKDIPKIILVFFESFFSSRYSKHTWIKRPMSSIKVAKNISRV